VFKIFNFSQTGKLCTVRYGTCKKTITEEGGEGSSVPDPWHFGVDPDPDPLIHASD
jgi:hypothetical protein